MHDTCSIIHDASYAMHLAQYKISNYSSIKVLPTQRSTEIPRVEALVKMGCSSLYVLMMDLPLSPLNASYDQNSLQIQKVATWNALIF